MLQNQSHKQRCLCCRSRWGSEVKNNFCVYKSVDKIAPFQVLSSVSSNFDENLSRDSPTPAAKKRVNFVVNNSNYNSEGCPNTPITYDTSLVSPDTDANEEDYEIPTGVKGGTDRAEDKIKAKMFDMIFAPVGDKSVIQGATQELEEISITSLETQLRRMPITGGKLLIKASIEESTNNDGGADEATKNSSQAVSLNARRVAWTENESFKNTVIPTPELTLEDPDVIVSSNMELEAADTLRHTNNQQQPPNIFTIDINEVLEKFKAFKRYLHNYLKNFRVMKMKSPVNCQLSTDTIRRSTRLQTVMRTWLSSS
jgi:hypothetical protein